MTNQKTARRAYVRRVCPSCKGTHLVNGRLCREPGCDGTGFVMQEKPAPIFSERIDNAIDRAMNALWWGVMSAAVYLVIMAIIVAIKSGAHL